MTHAQKSDVMQRAAIQTQFYQARHVEALRNWVLDTNYVQAQQKDVDVKLAYPAAIRRHF